MTANIRVGNPIPKASKLEGMIVSGMQSSGSAYNRGDKIYSSDGATCPRRTVLLSMQTQLFPDADSSFSASGNGYMRIGTAIHDIITDALSKEGALVAKEAQIGKLDDSLNLRGYIDAIVTVGDELHVLEIKSCGKLPAAPSTQHIVQALLYSAATGLTPSILYFSRSVADFSGRIMMKHFPLTATTHDDYVVALGRVFFASMSYKRGQIPRIPYEFTAASDECKYCPFVQHCWEMPNVKIEDLELSPSSQAKGMLKGREKAEEVMDQARISERRNAFLAGLPNMPDRPLIAKLPYE